MRNLSKKTIKHLARMALFQMDPYNPIIRDIRKWESMNPEFARRERWRFYYVYRKILMAKERFEADIDYFIDLVRNYPSPNYALPAFFKEDSK